MKEVIVTMKQNKWSFSSHTEPIDEQSNNKLAYQKRNNRLIFLKILENLRFLSRQGLPMLGGSNNGNFMQLLLFEARYSSGIYKWLEKKNW